MWENIDQAQDLTWILEGMQNNTLVWVRDGSYDRRQAPTVSGAGWVIYCCKSGHMFHVHDVLSRGVQDSELILSRTAGALRHSPKQL